MKIPEAAPEAGAGRERAARSASFRAVAIDYDGTLSEGRRPGEDVLAAVAQARRRGLVIALVTGRILAELRSDFPDLAGRFDVVVAENGAILWRNGLWRALASPVAFELDEELAARGVRFRRGQVLLACEGAQEEEVLQAVRRLGLEYQLVRNRDALMVLPSGVNKGFGVTEALADLGISPHSTIAIGDAENDHSLLETCEIGVAVENAVGSLRARADVVLTQSDGKGVSELLGGPIPSGERRLEPARWQVELGRFEDGAPARISASRINVLIAGGSRSGKSYLAGLLAERLITLRYSVGLVDPEGDYLTIDHLHGVLRLGEREERAEAGPVPPRVFHQEPYGGVVVDLSLLAPDRRSLELCAVVRQLLEERAETGVPHWILVDEAHLLFTPGGAPRVEIDPSERGLCLVTYQPQDLEPALRDSVDVVLALPFGHRPLGAHERALATALSELAGRDVLPALQRSALGQALLFRPGAASEPRLFTVGPRSSTHVRHWHKYAQATLPSTAHFVFRTREGPTGNVAVNLEEFHRLLAVGPREVLQHHAATQDFSRWVGEVLRDVVLAETLAELEAALIAAGSAAGIEETRAEMLASIEGRYVG